MSMKDKLSTKVKGIPVFAVAFVLVAGLGAAATLTYYGTTSGTAHVQQSVVLKAKGADGTSIATSGYDDNNPIGYCVAGKAGGNCKTATAGNTYVNGDYKDSGSAISHFTLKNRANQAEEVNLVTSDIEGITTKYYKLADTTETTVEDADGYDLEDNSDLCAINHNVDFETSYEGDNVVFKIHTPDGFTAESCCGADTREDTAAFAFDVGNDEGTGWNGYDFQVMYEPGSSYYNWGPWGYADKDGGWHDDHYKLGETEGVDAEKVGDYLEVTVSTDKLGGVGNSYGRWITLKQETGRRGCDNPSGPDLLSVTPGEKDGVTIGSEISNPVPLEAGGTFDFAVVNKFATKLEQGDYTIESKIK